jgi:hypothetical protein
VAIIATLGTDNNKVISDTRQQYLRTLPTSFWGAEDTSFNCNNHLTEESKATIREVKRIGILGKWVTFAHRVAKRRRKVLVLLTMTQAFIMIQELSSLLQFYKNLT